MDKTNKFKRGQIYWIGRSLYKPQVGCVQEAGRPGIIVSNDLNNAHAYTLEVVYLTTAPKKYLPTHCKIRSAERPSTALCEQVTTISDEQIREYIGTCTAEEMAEVDRCIAIGVNLPDPKETAEKIATLHERILTLEQQLEAAHGKVEILKELGDILKKITDE